MLNQISIKRPGSQWRRSSNVPFRPLTSTSGETPHTLQPGYLLPSSSSIPGLQANLPAWPATTVLPGLARFSPNLNRPGLAWLVSPSRLFWAQYVKGLHALAGPGHPYCHH
ncbi:hypothetical protein LWI28_004281 [Acer negundo]|uniref:Uncharacterized protein n=1 Tax=Acer negundo TaxID=4023 RepID=A0AAD5JP83_ACENE|nr:hypothetical protein LWI28_004281 [Acer negundo]